MPPAGGRRRGGLRGQIATLMVLIMAAVLIFVMMTANLGQLAVASTTVANAADSASLILASQLATKAHFLWRALGRHNHRCRRVTTFWDWALNWGTWFGGATRQHHQTERAMAKLEKALNGLPAYEQYRQSAILEALYQTVEDPTMVQDRLDDDGDGDTTELIPRFIWWWQRRMEYLKGNLSPDLATAVEQFINTLRLFVGVVRDQISLRNGSPGPFVRKQIEGNNNYQGIIEEVTDKLEDYRLRGTPLTTNTVNYLVSFWEPGPTLLEYQRWRNSGCEDCEPDGWDEVDATIEELKDLIDFSEQLFLRTTEELVLAWREWVYLFYDPAGGADWLDILNWLVNGDPGNRNHQGMRAWRSELGRIKTGLPRCGYSSNQGCVQRCRDERGPSYPCERSCASRVTNAACRDPASYGLPDFATVDADMINEFKSADEELKGFTDTIERFSEEAGRQLRAITILGEIPAGTPPSEFGAANPATYSWRDSRGDFSVTVEVGQFREPRTQNYRRGSVFSRRYCIRIINLDEGGERTWVRITRREPQNVSLGFFNWNPFDGRIEKLSRAYYNATSVGIRGGS